MANIFDEEYLNSYAQPDNPSPSVNDVMGSQDFQDGDIKKKMGYLASWRSKTAGDIDSAAARGELTADEHAQFQTRLRDTYENRLLGLGDTNVRDAVLDMKFQRNKEAEAAKLPPPGLLQSIGQQALGTIAAVEGGAGGAITGITDAISVGYGLATGQDPTETDLYKWGQNTQQFWKDLQPDAVANGWLGKLGGAVGSGLGFIGLGGALGAAGKGLAAAGVAARGAAVAGEAAAVVGEGASAASGAATAGNILTKGGRYVVESIKNNPGIALLGGVMNAGSSYREARDMGYTNNEAMARMGVGFGLGLTESIGLGTQLTRIDQITGGTFKNLMLWYGKEALEEGAQETGQNLAQGLFDILYKNDKNKAEFGQVLKDSLESGTYAALSAILIGSAGGAQHYAERVAYKKDIDAITQNAIDNPQGSEATLSNLDKTAEKLATTDPEAAALLKRSAQTIRESQGGPDTAAAATADAVKLTQDSSAEPSNPASPPIPNTSQPQAAQALAEVAKAVTASDAVAAAEGKLDTILNELNAPAAVVPVDNAAPVSEISDKEAAPAAPTTGTPTPSAAPSAEVATAPDLTTTTGEASAKVEVQPATAAGASSGKSEGVATAAPSVTISPGATESPSARATTSEPLSLAENTSPTKPTATAVAEETSAPNSPSSAEEIAKRTAKAQDYITSAVENDAPDAVVFRQVDPTTRKVVAAADIVPVVKKGQTVPNALTIQNFGSIEKGKGKAVLVEAAQHAIDENSTLEWGAEGGSSAYYKALGFRPTGEKGNHFKASVQELQAFVDRNSPQGETTTAPTPAPAESAPVADNAVAEQPTAPEVVAPAEQSQSQVAASAEGATLSRAGEEIATPEEAVAPATELTAEQRKKVEDAPKWVRTQPEAKVRQLIETNRAQAKEDPSRALVLNSYADAAEAELTKISEDKARKAAEAQAIRDEIKAKRAEKAVTKENLDTAASITRHRKVLHAALKETFGGRDLTPTEIRKAEAVLKAATVSANSSLDQDVIYSDAIQKAVNQAAKTGNFEKTANGKELNAQFVVGSAVRDAVRNEQGRRVLEEREGVAALTASTSSEASISPSEARGNGLTDEEAAKNADSLFLTGLNDTIKKVKTADSSLENEHDDVIFTAALLHQAVENRNLDSVEDMEDKDIQEVRRTAAEMLGVTQRSLPVSKYIRLASSEAIQANSEDLVALTQEYAARRAELTGRDETQSATATKTTNLESAAALPAEVPATMRELMTVLGTNENGEVSLGTALANLAANAKDKFQKALSQALLKYNARLLNATPLTVRSTLNGPDGVANVNTDQPNVELSGAVKLGTAHDTTNHEAGHIITYDAIERFHTNPSSLHPAVLSAIQDMDQVRLYTIAQLKIAQAEGRFPLGSTWAEVYEMPESTPAERAAKREAVSKNLRILGAQLEAGGLSEEQRADIEKAYAAERATYGLSSLHEFASETLSSGTFHSLLDSIDGSGLDVGTGKTLWQKVKEFIRTILFGGQPVGKGSVLDTAFNRTMDLVKGLGDSVDLTQGERPKGKISKALLAEKGESFVLAAEPRARSNEELKEYNTRQIKAWQAWSKAEGTDLNDELVLARYAIRFAKENPFVPNPEPQTVEASAQSEELAELDATWEQTLDRMKKEGILEIACP